MENAQTENSAAGGLSDLTDVLYGCKPEAWMYKNAYTDNWYLSWKKAKDRESVALFSAADMGKIGLERDDFARNILRLIETAKYLAGIAERGEGRKQRDDETTEQFVLGYVKRLEFERAGLVSHANALASRNTDMQIALAEIADESVESFVNRGAKSDLVLNWCRTCAADALAV